MFISINRSVAIGVHNSLYLGFALALLTFYFEHWLLQLGVRTVHWNQLFRMAIRGIHNVDIFVLFTIELMSMMRCQTHTQNHQQHSTKHIYTKLNWKWKIECRCVCVCCSATTRIHFDHKIIESNEDKQQQNDKTTKIQLNAIFDSNRIEKVTTFCFVFLLKKFNERITLAGTGGCGTNQFHLYRITHHAYTDESGSEQRAKKSSFARARTHTHTRPAYITFQHKTHNSINQNASNEQKRFLVKGYIIEKIRRG